MLSALLLTQFILSLHLLYLSNLLILRRLRGHSSTCQSQQPMKDPLYRPVLPHNWGEHHMSGLPTKRGAG